MRQVIWLALSKQDKNRRKARQHDEGLVKKYREGGGPEHFKMWWLENT